MNMRREETIRNKREARYEHDKEKANPSTGTIEHDDMYASITARIKRKQTNHLAALQKRVAQKLASADRSSVRLRND